MKIQRRRGTYLSTGWRFAFPDVTPCWNFVLYAADLRWETWWLEALRASDWVTLRGLLHARTLLVERRFT